MKQFLTAVLLFLPLAACNDPQSTTTLTVPTVSYNGAPGNTGKVGIAMSISPTTLKSGGSAITDCAIDSDSANAFPSSLTIDSTTCIISGRPTSPLAATQFNVVATNSVGTSTAAPVTLTINPGLPSMSFAGATGTTGQVGVGMNIVPTVIESSGAPITACGLQPGSATASLFPAGLTIDNTTCAISGIPTTAVSATTFSIVATNSAGVSSPATVSLTVNAVAPSLSYAATPNVAVVGTPITIAATLNDNGSPVTSCGIKSGSITSGLFPSSLTINASTCVISGTPTAVLPATTFTIVAMNAAGTSNAATVNLTINAGLPVVSFAGATGTVGSVNTAMNVAPTTISNNGANITACGIQPGSPNASLFPTTLTIDRTVCVISGTPTAVLPATTFTLVAVNSTGNSTAATVTLTVNAAVPTLSYAGVYGASTQVGTAITLTPTLTSNGAAITGCALASGSASLPSSLTINSTTCVISGTPTEPLPSTTFSIVATNSVGKSAQATLTLQIASFGIRQLGSGLTTASGPVALDSTGNIYIAGWTTGGLDGNPATPADTSIGFIAKYNSGGQLAWATEQYPAGVSMADQPGMSINSLAIDASGNLYSAGSVGYPFLYSSSSYIAKYNSAGLMTASWQPGDSTTGSSVSSIALDAQGNIYSAGMTQAGLYGKAQTGTYDYFIAKYDNSGNLLWYVQQGIAKQSSQAYGLALDGSGNVYVGGTMANNTFVALYSSTGTLTWIKQLTPATPPAFSATNNASVLNVAVDASGNLYASGQTGGGLNGNTLTGQVDYFVLKYDHNGNLIWLDENGVVGTIATVGPLVTDSSQNVYFSETNSLNSNTSLFKLNSAGASLWTVSVGRAGVVVGGGIVLDPSTNLFLAGSTDVGLNGNTQLGFTDAFIAKYNSSGILQ